MDEVLCFLKNSAVIKSALYQFSASSDLSVYCWTMLIHAFLTSWFVYCNVLCIELPLNISWKPQLVQNAVALLMSRAN